jgi:hypothetical protein
VQGKSLFSSALQEDGMEHQWRHPQDRRKSPQRIEKTHVRQLLQLQNYLNTTAPAREARYTFRAFDEVKGENEKPCRKKTKSQLKQRTLSI